MGEGNLAGSARVGDEGTSFRAPLSPPSDFQRSLKSVYLMKITLTYFTELGIFSKC